MLEKAMQVVERGRSILEGNLFHETYPDFKALADLTIPAGRMQLPESVADAVPCLSSAARNYMTSQTILIDGGSALYPMI